MPGFEALYRPARDATEALRPLVARLYTELQATPLDVRELKGSLLVVLEFLASPLGRTDENCRTVDAFLSQDDAWNAGRLPESYVDIVSDMCGALHDAIAAPEIAQNFEATPEQLLERARRL